VRGYATEIICGIENVSNDVKRIPVTAQCCVPQVLSECCIVIHFVDFVINSGSQFWQNIFETSHNFPIDVDK